MAFAHLRLHALCSLLDGAIRMKDLIRTVKEKGMSSVAVTDHGNMFGAIDFYKKARDAGIKPILGMEAYVAGPKGREDRTEKVAHHLILLAKDQEGYANLRYLSSTAYLDGFYYPPRVDKMKHSRLGCRSHPRLRSLWTLHARRSMMHRYHLPDAERGYLQERLRMMAKSNHRNAVVSDGLAGLDISFATRMLRELCESETKARHTLGAVAAERLKHRIADFLAAANVAELPRVCIPQDGHTEIEVELADEVFLSFRANHNRMPISSNGTVDWSQVKRIQIMRIWRRK